MKTPAGTDCDYYYEDFHRGRSRQECRLARRNAESAAWQPSDCEGCPVPEILWANASPNLILRLTIKPGVLGIGRRNVVEAACRKHDVPIEDPVVGCPQCAAERPGLDIFFKE